MGAKKSGADTTKKNPFGNEMNPFTADKKLDTVVAALSQFPAELVKTITCDRGTEFANGVKIEKRLHCDIYFAVPYCAWQKGINENSNGLLRES